MPACIFFLPNSILSTQEAKQLGAHVFPDALREYLKGFDEPRTVRIFENQALSGFAGIQWVWMMLTQRENLAPTAPYLWKGLGGPKVHQEFWALNGYRIDDGVLKSAGDVFDIEEECDLRDLLNPIARRFNFEIQVLDGRFFFTRKTAWPVVCAPWLAQQNKPAAPAAGPAAQEFNELSSEISRALSASSFNKQRKENGRPALEGFWINGGAFEEQLLPYTQIRCCLTSNPTIRGIAEAAGINRAYVKSSVRNWPDCPEGDLFCILDEFKDSIVKSDPLLWETAWADALEKVKQLSESAKGFEKYFPRLVACDGLHVSVIEKTQDSKASFAFWKKEKDHTHAWLCPKI